MVVKGLNKVIFPEDVFRKQSRIQPKTQCENS